MRLKILIWIFGLLILSSFVSALDNSQVYIAYTMETSVVTDEPNGLDGTNYNIIQSSAQKKGGSYLHIMMEGQTITQKTQM